MRSTMTIAVAAAAGLAAAGCATLPGQAGCSRDCLIETTDVYLASLVLHDPTMAPLSADVVIVENAQRIEPGDGLWDSANAAPTDFAIYVPDPVAQTVGFLGVMTVNDAPTVVALRLKLGGGGIVEAEHLVTNAITNEGSLANLATPRPGLVSEVPPAERMSREDLLRIGGSYYDALDDNDGTLAPFAADCERHENGFITAGPGPGPGGPPPGGGAAPAGSPVARDCAGQLTSQAMAYIDSLDNRRMFAADPVTGLAMGLSHFRHSMTRGEYEVTALDGTKVMRNPSFNPFDLPAAHVYKITNGEIHEIEAMGFMAPYMAPTGWE
jgi:hypothetical protein